MNVEVDRQILAHSSEVEQLQLQIRDVNAEKNLVTAKMEAELREIKSQVALYEQSKLQLAQEREMNRKLMTDICDLQSNLSKSRLEETTLRHAMSELQTLVQMKDASAERKDSELEAKSKALEEKNTTIAALREQLTKAREYLRVKQQVSTQNMHNYYRNWDMP